MRQSLLALTCSALLIPALAACTGSISDQGVQLSTDRAKRAPAETDRKPAIVSAGQRNHDHRDPEIPAGTKAAASAQAAGKPRPGTGGPQQSGQLPNPPFVVTPKATFDQPWAMTFLPDGRLLVTEKPGKLKLYNPANNAVGDITGVPTVAYGGQGGFGDVILHPQYASNRYVYFSYAEAGANNTRGAVVARAQLTLDNAGGGSIGTPQIIWKQTPKIDSMNHYSHRLLFDGNGKLWITSGERQLGAPAQDLSNNLGKIVRLNDDGTVPADNPFANQGGVTAQIWSYGHRNALGIARDAAGRIWAHEMGPAGGDELNMIERGSNYGWPNVSNGSNYDGTPIPDHAPGDGYNAPKAWWNPVIAPAGFIIYSGDMFPYFRGQGFIGGLASQALVRIQFDGDTAREAERYPMGHRIREVEQGPDGAIWLLEDLAGGRLLKLTPVPL